MNTLVPDTLNGAILVSVIDFFLSFFVISFIGIVLALLPLLNRIRLAAADNHQTPPVSASEGVDVNAEHLAAISAAIAVIVGDHRILHIEPAHNDGAWQSEVRTAHHSSHQVAPRSSRAPR